MSSSVSDVYESCGDGGSALYPGFSSSRGPDAVGVVMVLRTRVDQLSPGSERQQLYSLHCCVVVVVVVVERKNGMTEAASLSAIPGLNSANSH